LDYVVYVIKDGSGNPVADLIVVSGPDGAGINVLKNGDNQDKSFNFDTKIINPNLYAKVSNIFTIKNIVTLFSINNRLNSASASVSPRPNFLRKDMVENKYAAAEDLLNDNNHMKSTTTASKGFNYLDRSVVFRLHVNHRGDGDFTEYQVVDGNGNITTMGAITVTDTLPEGWEFINVIDGEKYLIYEGDSSIGGFVNPTNRITGGAIDSILESSIFSDAAGENEKATFEFKKLDVPYIIYLRAQPSEDKVKEYFNINNTSEVTNNMSLKGENWDNGISTTRKVSIESEVLSKSLDSSVDGEITWTVEYKPDEVNLLDTPPDNMIITDTLSPGMELPVDANGKLDFTGTNFKVEKLTLQADGTYTSVEISSETLGDYYSYNFETRELTINILNQKKAYRFTYVSDLVGKVNTTIENTVELTGIDFGSPIEGSYRIDNDDVSASRKKNGYIEITKVNTNDEAIEGVEFAVFTLNGYQLRTGETNASGKLELRGLPPGTFTLEETKAVIPYVISDQEYNIVAVADGGSTTVSIDEKTGDDSNKITITNTQIKADIEFKKVDEWNAPIQGAEFGLYDDSNTKLATASSISTGIVLFEDVKYGDYTVKETSPAEGYLDNLDNLEVLEATVGDNDNESTVYAKPNGETTEDIYSMVNTIKKGNLTITKVDQSDTDKKLSGAEFSIFEIVGETEDLKYTITTDEKGEAELKDIPYGDYIVKESKAPSGYYLNSEGQTFQIVSNGDSISLTFENKKRPSSTRPETTGSITITKTDSEDEEKLLEGAVFEIRDSEDNVVRILATGSNGKAKADELSLGDYTIIETSAPEGYTSDETVKEVFIGYTLDVQVKITNEKLDEVVPEEPVDPEDPEEPVDPEDPEEPVDPEDPEEPEDTEDPEDPEDPQDEGTDVYETEDPENEIIEVVDPPRSGEVTIEDGKVKYTPDDTYDGEDKIVIKVTKDDGTEEIITIEINEDLIPLEDIVELPDLGVDTHKLLYFVISILSLVALIITRKRITA